MSVLPATQSWSTATVVQPVAYDGSVEGSHEPRNQPAYKVELDRLAKALVRDMDRVSVAVVSRVLYEIPELGGPDSEEPGKPPWPAASATSAP